MGREHRGGKEGAARIPGIGSWRCYGLGWSKVMGTCWGFWMRLAGDRDEVVGGMWAGGDQDGRKEDLYEGRSC